MLRLDFEQSLNNHRRILILVKPIGYIGDKRFGNVLEEISQFSQAQVPNSTRTLYLKYSQQISPQFIEWSSFHAHRRVLGLICVARCTDIKEMEKLTGKINDLKSQFDSTLLDSRCLVFGCKPEDGAKIRKDFVFIEEESMSEELERHMAEFVASLFNVLESKRMSKLSEKPEKVAPIYAPVEQEPNGGDDSRSYKRRFVGRSRKYLGDLSMLVGLPQDALCHYTLAMEHLRAVNDFLWLAGSIEGQCAASVAINLLGKDSGTKYLVLPTDCAAKAANVTSNGFGNDVDEAKFRNIAAFTYDETYERLSEAIYLYGRVKGAAVVEVEAHLKLTRLLIAQRKSIEASIALQNALSVNIQLTEQEKIQRYSSAAKLYTYLGFHRKAAFFTRVAAMQCVSPSLPAQGWPASYSLLVQALEGYKIHLNPKEFLKDHPYGWPTLQIRLLHELVFTSRRLGDPSLALRHMVFLLHTMHQYLSDAEKSDLAVGLETIAKQCAGSPMATGAIENSKIPGGSFPAVSLTRMPFVRCLNVHPLPTHLKPVGRKKASTANSPSKGPFIFSSLRRNPKEAKKRKNTLWVQGELGHISMEVYNPMPFELKVAKMVLCTEGVDFEPFPACLSLPPHTGPHSVILLGIPLGTGQLSIMGYTVSVLGTESTCPLTRDHLEIKEDFPIVVDIVESMPLLQVSTSLPKVRSAPLDPDSPQTAPLVTAVTLYAGQSMQGTITLENIGGRAIEEINICLNTDQGEGVNEIFSFDEEEVKSCLPLAPGNSANIKVTITGIYHVPSGIGSSENIHYDPEAPWGLNGIIQFRYFGGVGVDQLYRRVSMTIDVTVASSLHCHNYEVRPLPSDSGKCLLLFDADNKTSNDMELEYSVKASNDADTECDINTQGMLSIQGNDSKRVGIYLPRFLLPRPDVESVSTTEKERRREYSRAVREMVVTNWKLPACHVSGFGNLDNFSLDAEMLSRVKPDPVVFDVRVNDEPFRGQTGVTVSLGTTINIGVKVTNTTDMIYEQVSIAFDPYQDHANGYIEIDLHGKLAWVGELRSHSPVTLSPGESLLHTCSFAFFYTGEFLIQIKSTETHLLSTLTNSETRTKGETARGLQYPSSSVSQSWTFNPPLKITVTT